MVDRVAMGQVCGGQSGKGHVCGGQSGTGTGLWWTEWHWDMFVVDRVAQGQGSSVFGC